MKRKLIYECPLSEEFELNLANGCLQSVSDMRTTNNDNPMGWGYYEEDGE